MLTVDQIDEKTLVRMFSKIDIDTDTGCWVWVGSKRNEYSNFGYQGRTEYVHRVMFAWLVGPIPNGVGRDIPVLDHVVCDNRACCNPFHMQLTTQRRNILRGNSASAENVSRDLCRHGHQLSGRTSLGYRFCLECRREYDRRRNPTQKRREQGRLRYRRNPEPAKARARARRARAKDRPS